MRAHENSTNDSCLLSQASTCNIEKYWDQRYRFFSRFDEGVSLDEESWFSVSFPLVLDCNIYNVLILMT